MGLQRATRDVQTHRIRLFGLDELYQGIQTAIDAEVAVLDQAITLNTERPAVVDVIDDQFKQGERV